MTKILLFSSFLSISISRLLLFPFLIILLITFSNLHAQEATQVVKVTPPSPNAASLGVYGDIPVGNYTGVPSISIPIHTVESGEIEMPITLNYHASGIKVAQEASWVGLGWSLSAGGVITRQIRGRDDFDFNGYITAPELPPYNEDNTPDWSDPDNPDPTNTDNFSEYGEKYSEFNSGYMDAQPDIFYYNFLDNSGKLVFEKGSYEAIPLDQNNLKFMYDKQSGSWEITDGNGWKYLFGTKEISAHESETRGYKIDRNDGPFTGGRSEDKVTAWYLDKIVTPGGDEVNFVYKAPSTTGGFIKSPIYNSYQEHRIVDYDVITSAVFYDPIVGKVDGGWKDPALDNYSKYTATMNLDKEVVLDKITFSNGYIKFVTSDRQDRDVYITGLSGKSQKLDNMDIYNSDNVKIKGIDFKYSYFNENYNGARPANFFRLKLDNVKEQYFNGYTTIEKPPFNFFYNDTPLPEKNSYEIDHWGFANGSKNDNVRRSLYVGDRTHSQVILDNNDFNYSMSEELVPFYGNLSYGSSETPDISDHFVTGGNRDPNFKYAQAGILEKIEYPTGGVTEFEYELNDYSSTGEDLFEKLWGHISVYSSGPSEKEFTLASSGIVFLYFTFSNYLLGMLGYEGLTTTDIYNWVQNMEVVLEKSNGDDCVVFRPDDYLVESASYGVSAYLQPGTYRLKAQTGDAPIQLMVSAYCDYVHQVPTNKKLGAGLRIKSVKSYERLNGKLLGTKIFTYESEGMSTGKLMSPVQYVYSGKTRNNWDNAGQIHEATWIKNNTENIIPLGNSAQGNYIGYSSVKVSNVDGDGVSIGSSIYYYKNIPEIPTESFLPGVPNLVNNSNGQLIREEHYDSEKESIKKKEYFYSQDNSVKKTIKGVTTAQFLADEFRAGDSRFFDINSEWWYLEKIKETDYDQFENEVAKVEEFKYSNPLHKLLTEKSVVSSDGKNYTQNYYYPSDFPTGTETSIGTFEQMVDDHILSPVVRMQKTVDGTFSEGYISNFIIDGHDHAVLDNTKLYDNQKQVYEPLANYKYNESGRLIQSIDKSGNITSYIWGYNNAYLIAKGENIDHDELEDVIKRVSGTTDLDSYWKTFGNVEYNNIQWQLFNESLRNDPDLSNAMVITFNYEPLKGLRAQSDQNGVNVFYEYDEFNRLRLIRDSEGSILKNYDYKYDN